VLSIELLYFLVDILLQRSYNLTSIKDCAIVRNQRENIKLKTEVWASPYGYCSDVEMIILGHFKQEAKDQNNKLQGKDAFNLR